MMPGMYEDWRITVIPSEAEIEAAEEAGLAPFGTPSEKVVTLTNHNGVLTFQDDFEQSMLGREGVTNQHENTLLKDSGSNDIQIPPGYDHMLESILTITEDQTAEKGGLFKHARMNFTYREIVFPEEKRDREVHVDPPRRESVRSPVDEGEAVAKDAIFFISNKKNQSTITQSAHVINPSDTLNRMKPEVMIECGLMHQAEPFEVWKGTEDTYHVQAEKYDPGRILVRVIVSMPGIDYFHDLPDEEKAGLPEEFREKHGIKISGAETAPDLSH